MKTYMVMGVECVKMANGTQRQVSALGRDLGLADDYDDTQCTLCPAEKARSDGDRDWRYGCNCNGNGYVPKQYVPILIMRGITILEEP